MEEYENETKYIQYMLIEGEVYVMHPGAVLILPNFMDMEEISANSFENSLWLH